MPDKLPQAAAHADPALPRAIAACRRKLAIKLPPRDVDRLARYLGELGKEGLRPPGRGRGFDWDKISIACALPPELIEAAKDDMLPALRMQARAGRRAQKARTKARSERPSADEPKQRNAPGRKAHIPVEFPTPCSEAWDDPPEFHRALALHMDRHGDSSWRLHAAVRREDERLNYSTILTWRRGQKAPQDALSFSILARIEHRYRLPAGYFTEKLKSAPRATRGAPVLDIAPSEMRRLAWHLPNDLRDRSLAEQEEIVSWVRNVIISGATDYRRYQAAAMKQRYGLRFATQLAPGRSAAIDLRADDLKAPRTLNSEMEALVAFKTSTLTTAGYARSGVWGPVTADQRTEHLSLLFGALMAPPDGPVRGRGIPSDKLTLALLLFPAVWDWYVQWRERRRGFYTSWEVDLLQLGVALARAKTGWLRQTPSIGTRLQPIEGLVSLSDIEAARSDWDGACDRLYAHGLARAKEIERVARVHRDPFEPILPILEADSPLGEYRKITEEIIRRMPDARRYPKAAAEAVRGFLMLRIGLHTGLRQKNLRQLLVCHRGAPQRSERQLTDARKGELRWNEREAGWEVLIPSAAFKNASSSFFGNRPFRLVLPDLGGLYDTIDAYLARHRGLLLAGRSDPDTFFVKTMKVTSHEAAYDQNTFYEAWRLTIQRYGIYNPYTDRGAIKGLLPHGPHNVRDVLATHILKQTGSYEQASYAVQDTPEMVAKHYGRFLPQDKAALAAQVLNKAWA